MTADTQIKHFWLYILKLVDHKYYVGITTKVDPYKRIAQHYAGHFSAAQWTKKYKPVETLEVRDLGNITQTEADRLEDKQTLEYMKLYGYQNVRGGKYNYSGKYVRVGSHYWRGVAFDNVFGLSFVLITLVLLVVMVLLRQ